MPANFYIADNKRQKLGDEAPTWKEFVIVFLAAAMLIGFSSLAWHKFGWFY